MRKRVGVFRYPVQVGDAAGGRFVERWPLVDTGALYSRFPGSFLAGLGHRPNATHRFRLADGPANPVNETLDPIVASLAALCTRPRSAPLEDSRVRG